MTDLSHASAAGEFPIPNQVTSTAEPANQSALQAVKFDYTAALPQILEHLGAALLISTYQAGKLVVLGCHAGQLTVSVKNFDRPMGVAVGPHSLAVGTRRQIQFLSPADEVAPTLKPEGSFDRCWVPRSTFHTGSIQSHELAWGNRGLWVVNTLFSCLCTLHEGYNFVPRWRPKFVSQLIDQDRCHLNGMALLDGEPKYVTAMAESDQPAGWRPTKATSGCIIDVSTDEVIARGLSMPHSPRLYNGKLWVLDSGKGRLNLVNERTGQQQTVVEVPGYTRGLAFCGQFAFVGMSRIRETSVFGGVPIAERREELRCGMAVIDLVSGQAVAKFEFHNGVEEVFAVDVLPKTRNPAVFGPTPDEDQQQDVWIVPTPGRIPSVYEGRSVFAIGPGSKDSAQSPEVGYSKTAAPKHATDEVFINNTGLEVESTSAADKAQRLTSRGILLHRQGRFREAIECLTQAAELAEDPAPALTDLGNVYQDQGNQEQALECYRQAIQQSPDCVPARQNLGYLLFNHGEPRQALENYEIACRCSPSPMNRLLTACVLPVVYESSEDVSFWRRRLETGLQQLVQDGTKIDTRRQLVPTSFFTAYQGLNDRPVMANLGQLYVGENCLIQPGDSPSSTRIRVGFLSAYFRDHTIGRLNLGRITQLSRQHFEVTVISTGRHADQVSEQFRKVADQFVSLPRDIAEARQLIATLKLDILVFTDVGMDALTSTLAFSRMAPVQCVTWGHPDTTGSPYIDFFLSSELLETADAELHYTEKLIRLSNLGTVMERPVRLGPAKDRNDFGLNRQSHLYLCPQTLFKFHPDFDQILAGILNADPLGELVLIEGRVPNWTRKLQNRLASTLPDGTRRCRFLPSQPRDDFLSLLEAADVILDPLHFGGGHTSYEALGLGVPVVTLPSPFLRGRITQALYRRMRLSSLIVTTPEQYIRTATELGTNPDLRHQTSQEIMASSDVLFNNADDVRAFEQFLISVAP